MKTSYLDTSIPKKAAKSRRRRVQVAPCPPTLAQARERLEAARGGSQPWLRPEATEGAAGVPEVIGPKTYRKV
jgi:hypothetical protein